MIPAFKKIGELLGDYLAGVTGLEIVNYRIGAIWGPLGRRRDPFFPAAQLVHAAVRGTAPDLSLLRSPVHAEDATRPVLRQGLRPGHRAAAARRTTSATARTTSPPAGPPPTPRSSPRSRRSSRTPGSTCPPAATGPQNYLDITRIHQDTGYQPAYDTERAVADYIGWLQAGHER